MQILVQSDKVRGSSSCKKALPNPSTRTSSRCGNSHSSARKMTIPASVRVSWRGFGETFFAQRRFPQYYRFERRLVSDSTPASIHDLPRSVVSQSVDRQSVNRNVLGFCGTHRPSPFATNKKRWSESVLYQRLRRQIQPGSP
jgi:hypothetical protein